MDTQMKPTKGSLLLAEPFMNDGFFERTVVLICDNDSTGSMGLVLNMPYEDGYIKLDGLTEVNTLLVGGPVSGSSLMIVHQDADIAEAWPLGNNCFLNGNTEEIIKEWQNGGLNEQNCFFFLGYSGWGQGQLEGEIEQGGWIVYQNPGDALQKILSTDPVKRWATTMKALGGKHAEMAHYPRDPRLN